MPDDRRWPPTKQKTPDNKVTRITEHTRGLVDDVKEWVELRIQLAKLEVAHEVNQRKTQVVVGVTAAVVALVAVLFMLVAAALGLGAWLGHPAWGFLAISVLLLLVAALLGAMMRNMGPSDTSAGVEIAQADATLRPPAPLPLAKPTAD
ncbi:MAG: phage holin family protein [Bacteroidota bacterium]